MTRDDTHMQKDFFFDLICSYGRAFDNFDLEAILNAYHTSCFIF